MHRNLSVVIPTKNRPDFLRKLMEPLRNYSEDIQVIVIDDGSDSETAEQNRQICAQAHVADYSRILKSNGAAAARNIGMKKSNCQYIWFIDDDDQVPELTIRDVLHEISIASAGVLLLPMTIQYKDSTLNTIRPKPEHQNYQYYRQFGQQVNTSCAIFRREDVARIGGWDEKLVRGDDTSLFLLLSQHCSFYCIQTQPIIVNVGHSKRMTRGVIKEQLGKLQFLRKHWKHLGNRRKMYYIVSFILISPAFLHARLGWKKYRSNVP